MRKMDVCGIMKPVRYIKSKYIPEKGGVVGERDKPESRLGSEAPLTVGSLYKSIFQKREGS
jgi:hypothetical protein